MDIINRILDKKLIAILRGLSPDEALRVTEALLAGGIELVEVTFPQKPGAELTATTESIRRIGEQFDVPVGAGTVMNTEQLAMAKDAGARYIISPNTDAQVIAETKRLGLISIPGALTPSEAVLAHNSGADFVKLFPAGVFGPSYVKALCAPLSHIRFMAVGGVNAGNAADLLRAGAVGLGVGGELVSRKLLLEGRMDAITALAAEYVRAAAQG